MDHRKAGGRKKGNKGTLSTKFHSLFNPSSNFWTKWKMCHETNNLKIYILFFIIKVNKQINVLNENK